MAWAIPIHLTKPPVFAGFQLRRYRASLYSARLASVELRDSRWVKLGTRLAQGVWPAADGVGHNHKLGDKHEAS